LGPTLITIEEATEQPVRLSKPDVIRAQLDGAIILVADEDSYVAAHTIVMACEELLRTWSDFKKIPYSTDWRSQINPKYRGREHTFIRGNYNFFKHADKDIDAETDIEPENMRQWNEIFLLSFIRGYVDLFHDLSWRMRIYYKWMAVQGIATDLRFLPHSIIIQKAIDNLNLNTPVEKRSLLRNWLGFSSEELPREAEALNKGLDILFLRRSPKAQLQ
jgi:hypothetical protein